MRKGYSEKIGRKLEGQGDMVGQASFDFFNLVKQLTDFAWLRYGRQPAFDRVRQVFFPILLQVKNDVFVFQIAEPGGVVQNFYAHCANSLRGFQSATALERDITGSINVFNQAA